jgi:hypothetical protein
VMTLRIVKYFVFVVFVSVVYFGACLSSLTVFAQSLNVTVQPGVSFPAHLTQGSVPTAYVTGYVFDEAGNPVPSATVTLRQDGNIWQVGKFMYCNGTNPMVTNIYSPATSGVITEGSFAFGLLFPGEYTMTAEKDGYKSSSVSFRVGEDTMSPNQLSATSHEIQVNITLAGYRVPTFTPEQRSYTGAIAGTIRDRSGGATSVANVSLWKDGHMVDAPDNPQASTVLNVSGRAANYAFEHLAPGHYTILVEYYGFDWNDSISVDVGTDTVMADIVSSYMGFPHPSIPPGLWASPTIDPSASPSTGPKATSALPGLATLIVIGLVTYYLVNKK